jgi:RND family efflux transporter MFP subunit
MTMCTYRARESRRSAALQSCTATVGRPKGLRYLAALLTIAGVTFVGCGKKEKEAEVIAPVRVAPAVKGSIRLIVNTDAVLFPRDQANVMSKIGAPVRRVLVNRGDRVKQGQVLAELESRDLVAAAQESKGQWAQAESNYRTITASAVPEQVLKAQTDLDAARDGLDAAKKLLESRQQLFKDGALARKQVDEAQVAFTQARGQFETAQQHVQALQSVAKEELIKTAAAQVDAAKGHYDNAQAQVDYSEVRSPISGVITDRPVYPGEMVNPGSPLVTVMDVSKVVARVNLGQDQAKNIKVGAEATVTPADGGELVPGKVTIVSPATDANSTTIQVWVEVDNADGHLRAGESVHVSIVAATVDGATLIPTAAVLPNDEGETIVLVVDDKSIAHEKVVQVGLREPEMVQIIAGVEVGDRVISSGGLGLEDKSKVRIMKPGEKKAGEKEEADDK